MTDTICLMFGLVVHGADIQDRNGAPVVLAAIRKSCPWLRYIFADGRYAGPKLQGALDKIGDWTVEIVKRSDAAVGFEVIPSRWVVERTIHMARKVPKAGQGLGEVHRISRGMDQHRSHQNHNPKARKVLLCLTEFRVRLLGSVEHLAGGFGEDQARMAREWHAPILFWVSDLCTAFL